MIQRSFHFICLRHELQIWVLDSSNSLELLDLVDFLPVYSTLQFNETLFSWIFSVFEQKAYLISQLFKHFKVFLTFVLQPFQYWSHCAVCLRSLFEQNISHCTSLRCLAPQSKLSSIICLYLAPFTVCLILTHLPVVCAEKPEDSMLLSQPFFKVVMVISCDCFLTDTELNIMTDKFKYSFNQCIQSCVFCSQSFSRLFAASRLLSWASLLLPVLPARSLSSWSHLTKICLA